MGQLSSVVLGCPHLSSVIRGVLLYVNVNYHFVVQYGGLMTRISCFLPVHLAKFCNARGNLPYLKSITFVLRIL